MNTVDRCYVLTRHMLTDPLKDIALHLNKDAQQAHALDEAFAAIERQLADLQADRDAAWRMAHGAAAGHEHVQALLKKIADVFGRTDGFDELPALVRKQGETANVHRDVSRMIDSMLRVFEQAGLTGPLDECARALVNDRAKLRVENEILRRDLADSKTREHAMTVDADRRNGLESDLATSRDRAKRLKETLTNVNARASDLAGELDTSREKVTRLEASLAAAEARITEMQHALAVGTRQRDLLQRENARLTFPSSALQREVGRVSTDGMVLIPEHLRGQLGDEVYFLTNIKTNYVEMLSRDQFMALTEQVAEQLDMTRPGQSTLLEDEQGHMVRLASEESDSEKVKRLGALVGRLRKTLLTAGAPAAGDIEVWALDVRNTLVGQRAELEQCRLRFHDLDTARRSELDEILAACSGLPFTFMPRDLGTPVGLFMGLREAALEMHRRLQASPVNPGAPMPVAGA